MSTDTYGMRPMPAQDKMDPEVRAQIQSNIYVIYEPLIAPHVHIATCRATDNTFMAFLVLHAHLLKTVWNPNLLAGDPKQTRTAAMLSLLESTEDKIREMLLKNGKISKKIAKDNKHCHKNSSPKGERGRNIPPRSDTGTFSEKGSLDYSIRPKEKERSFFPWRRTSAVTKSESVYTQTG